MEWLRWQRNPWGQEILRGLSWDLVWLALGAGLLFAVVHTVLYYWRWRPKNPSGMASKEDQTEVGKLVSERVPRHSLASRIFHWIMATSMLSLLFTGFLPILGLKFSWVAPHWISGLVLTSAILFHIIHASFWKGLSSMWITRQDLRDGWLAFRQILGLTEPTTSRTGKNPLENKLFHHATSISTLAVIVTGLLMMVKIDSPFWTRNPYLLPDDTWGIIYVVHGATSVAFITLIMTHIYFAIRPEKRWITLSMIFGWIPRNCYLEHYNPERWPVTQQTNRKATCPTPKDG